MPVAPGEVHYRKFAPLHSNPKVMVKEATVIVVLWNADLQRHRCERSAGILFVNVGYRKLAQRGLECGGCVEGEHVAYRQL